MVGGKEMRSSLQELLVVFHQGDLTDPSGPRGHLEPHTDVTSLCLRAAFNSYGAFVVGRVVLAWCCFRPQITMLHLHTYIIRHQGWKGMSLKIKAQVATVV